MTVIFGRNRHIAVPAMTGVRVHSHHGGASANGLLDALMAYWPGNEESGDALDAHFYEIDLTDTNTVTYADGNVYSTARQYTAANSEQHTNSHIALSGKDCDLTVAAWVYLDSKGSNRFIAGCDQGVTNDQEYRLWYRATDDRFRFDIFDPSTGSVGTATANTFGSPSTETWYFVLAWHDSVANTVSIQINNGTVDDAATSGPAASNSVLLPFRIGRAGGSTMIWDGRIGPTMVWKSAGGGGGVLTSTQRTALYNGGSGLPYSEFTASTTPIIAFVFDDALSGVYSLAYPYMAAVEMPGTVYVVSDWVGTDGYCTTAQLQTMDGAGWAMGNHSKTHANFTTLTQGEIETELDTCRDYLEGLGLTLASEHVAYPYGASDADTYAAMSAQGMLSGRLTSEAIQTLPFADPYQLKVRYVKGTTSLATAKGYIDALQYPMQSGIFLFHNIIASGEPGLYEWLQSDFEDLVDYAVASGCRLMNIADLYAAGYF